MDWTLIKTKSGKTFAQSAQDWQFLYDCTVEKLRKLNEDSYQVVVFTNQGGVSTGNTTIQELSQKFTAIHAELKFPILFLAAISANDKHRKPATGMFDFVESVMGCKVDQAKSFYCGDAAGRPATKAAKKDFSADDLKFAWNVGLRFETPESFFLGLPQTGVQQRLFQPKQKDSSETAQPKP